MFTKPTDRDVDCQASAYDMGYHDNYRVNIRTTVNDNNFIQSIRK